MLKITLTSKSNSDDIIHGEKGHKYIRKEPRPNGKYRYIYKDLKSMTPGKFNKQVVKPTLNKQSKDPLTKQADDLKKTVDGLNGALSELQKAYNLTDEDLESVMHYAINDPSGLEEFLKGKGQ